MKNEELESKGAKYEFIKSNLAYDKNVDPVVIGYIADICYFIKGGENVIHQLFRCGYCYYFAVMLKNAFQRGEVCWAAPFGHIVWQDDNGICYDIEGVYTGEAEEFIPISFLGDLVDDFKRIPFKYHNATKEEIEQVRKNYESISIK